MDQLDADTRVNLNRVVTMFHEAMPRERGGTVEDLRAGFEAVITASSVVSMATGFRPPARRVIASA